MIEEYELNSIFGLDADVWSNAKTQARNILIRTARSQRLIEYAELARLIDAIEFDPHGTYFRKFLGQLSREEDLAGRGMITAIVVHKDDQLPGPGFYTLAADLGRDVSDETRCWAQEVERVFNDWRSK